MSKPKYPLVLVKWEDAATWDAWHDFAREAQEPAKCVTVGFLIRQEKTFIEIAPTRRLEETVEGRGCSTWSIPRGCIKKIKRLKE